MRSAPLTLLLTVLLAAPAAAQDPVPTPVPTPTPAPTIAAGVTAGGVDLSGMTIEQATAALEPLAEAAAAPVILAVAGHRFTLPARRVELTFDANRSARRAFHAGLETPPAAGATLDVPLAIEFARRPLRRFVTRAAAASLLPARDARVRITLRRIYRSRGKRGRALPTGRANKAIEAALANPLLPRLITPGRVSVRPAIRTRDLRTRYGTVLTISRSEFKLRLFKNLEYVRSYGVAVGQPAYPTPTGLYSIASKQVNPTWTAPNSPWAGELAGQSVSGSDPSNPLKARWMGIVNGVGIHGTGQDWSIGTAASHGCIRMHVSDVIALYDRVPVGTPVLIQ